MWQWKRAVLIRPIEVTRRGVVKKAELCMFSVRRIEGAWVYHGYDSRSVLLSKAMDLCPEVFFVENGECWERVDDMGFKEKEDGRRVWTCFGPRKVHLIESVRRDDSGSIGQFDRVS